MGHNAPPLATADGTWPFVSPGPSGRFMASGRRYSISGWRCDLFR
jgi:hypothetical protein